MKVGDIVRHRIWAMAEGEDLLPRAGILVEWLPCTHPKQIQKIAVLTKDGMRMWAVQYCEVTK